MTKIRLKGRDTLDTPFPPHRLTPYAIWLQFGLHRGKIMTHKGKGEGPFGFDVDYYYLGDRKVAGYIEPHGRGTMGADIAQGALYEFLKERKQTLEEWGEENGAENWDGPEIPGFWNPSRELVEQTCILKLKLNKGEVQPYTPEWMLERAPRPRLRPRLKNGGPSGNNSGSQTT
jgi:hypothetical protein